MILPFDKVYCLHLTEATERYDNIMEQFAKLGITDQVNIWWTCLRPISTDIGNNIPTLHTKYYDDVKNGYNPNVYGSVFNVSFEFYTIIKQAYLRGFNTILLMEDDIRFKDGYDYESLFANLPEDWDILRLGFSDYHDDWIRKEEKFKTDDSELLKINWQFGGMCLIALNRNAMKYYIDYMEAKFECADYPFTFVYHNKQFHPNGKELVTYVARQSIVDVGGTNKLYTLIGSNCQTTLKD